MYEMCQMNRLWLTQIYLYRWYIPDLIRLANDIETNPGPVVVDNIDSSKTICAPYSQPSAVFNYEQNVRKSTRNHDANKKPAVFTSLSQRVNYCKILLSTDIERNPGPGIVDPTKTIAAPYSQGNVEIFGTANAGTQCVAMSLSALVFNFRNSITSSADLVQIMNIGNNMYSALSQSAKQGLLLLTDLPCMVNLCDTNYQLTYSESYSGLINSFAPPIIADFPYVASLSAALNRLVMDNYHAFILTVDIYTVAIYCLPNGGYKVFDSHSRDLFGMAHPYGTCTLVEIDSLMNLVQYFQNIYVESNTYEIKGVNIIEMQSNNGNTTNLHVENDDFRSNEHLLGNEIYLCSCKECCAISFYSICFSTLKSCNYWTSQTVDSIIENGKTFYQKYYAGKYIFISDLPNKLDIGTANVKVVHVTRYQGYLSCNDARSKQQFKSVILDNKKNSTGFLMWISSYCISCIFHWYARQKLSYNFFVYNDTKPTHVPKVFSDVDSVVDLVCCVIQSKFNVFETKFDIVFLKCSCELSNIKRKQIIRKHKSASEIASTGKRREKYSLMDTQEKQELLLNYAENYRSMDREQKSNLLYERKQKYNDMEPESKKQKIDRLKEQQKEARKVKANQTYTLDHYITIFKQKIREGPYYICSVCNRILYRKSVLILLKSKYYSQQFFTDTKSFDGKEYICKTCHSKVSKGNLPCQAVYNNLYVDKIPEELSSLEKLEQILIAQRIVFQKIVIMPKGQQRKIKGAICNVPVECEETCRLLPRPSSSSGIILLKLKRKLEFRGHVYFQAVRPQLLLNALNWLKNNNPLYKNITIHLGNIDTAMTLLQPHEDNSVSDVNDKDVTDIESSSNVLHDKADEEIEDPLNEHRLPISETCLQSLIPDYPLIEERNENLLSVGNEIYNIAPGENKHPVSLMTDEQCEELAFPTLFPMGRFGFTAQRDKKLTPVKYFNARLLHYSGRFATNPEYLFFAQFIIEQKKVSDNISIAMKKVIGQQMTASSIRTDKQKLTNLIFKDQAYLFMRQIPGSPPYWQKFMYEVVAMVKQLGIPAWFMTLSCADLRWPELFQIIARTQGVNMTDEQVEALSYYERCSMLNRNPVVVAKHFQYRVETFFKEVLMTNANPIGKIIYYALRIEFQMRGSPHLHALIWTSDCPKLTHDNIQAYTEFVDNHVQAYLPNEETDPKLHELVATYQKHTHSKTCRKYKNIPCRFNFGQFFTHKTIVAKPLSDDLSEEQKSWTLTRRADILRAVKSTINEICDPAKPEYKPNLTAEEILISSGICEQDYYWALAISSDSDYELHLKRPPNSCFINNYFIAGIKAFAANVDLQPVFNHYKCVTYICSYFSKDETECSQAISNAAKEARNSNLNVQDSLRKIGAAFLSTREVSAQECVYRCMPELWLRKIFPKTLFVNTDFPQNRLRIPKSQDDLEELEDDSIDIFKSNIIQRYSNRPKSIVSVDKLCLAEFAAFYYKDYKIPSDETNDAQPDILTGKIAELQHSNTCTTETLPDKIKLLVTNEVMKCRKIRAVVRFHIPNKTKEPEKFFHHLLMLFFPWRDEVPDLTGTDQTYASKFFENDVQRILNINRAKFEQNADAVSEALELLRTNELGNLHSYDPFNDQENADMRCDLETDVPFDESFHEQDPEHFANSPQSNQPRNAIVTYLHPSDISDDLLHESIRSLNSNQRHAFNTVLTWCRTKMMQMNSNQSTEIEPLYLFLTGGGGTGKSHFIRAIYHTALKTFRHGPSNPEMPTLLMMAPTGVAAVNIDATTINTGLAIPKDVGDNLRALSDQKRTQLRISLAELKVIIIDEISMVSNTMLLNIHKRLKEIFATPNSRLFAGISIIAVGDLYQLPPIRQKPIFADYKNDALNLCHPWHCFKMIELDEIMRQKGDLKFTELLNRCRTASQTEDDIECIQCKSVSLSQDDYPINALHIWAENNPVNEHNLKILQELPKPLFVLRSVDQYPLEVTKQDIDKFLTKGHSETGGLDFEILIKEGARVMLTTNIDITDRLINGQMGTTVRIHIDQITNKPSKVYVKFDDERAGRITIDKSADSYATVNNVVPIVPVLVKIKIRPGKPSSPEIQRIQFPLTLAWACTVHKVQGLTLENIVVSFDLFKQRSFNYGQAYVALSRATSLSGLHILGNIQSKHIRADPRVHKEYQRLREASLDISQSHNQTESTFENNQPIVITLLNIRSLRKHSIDLKHDTRIFGSDVLLLTETQLKPTDLDDDIRSTLHPFQLFRQDSIDKYSSLALCFRNTLCNEDSEYFSSVNALKFVIFSPTTQKGKTLLLLYRKQSTNINQYLENLKDILDQNSIDIILGDFNINYLVNNNEVKVLKELMDIYTYTQIVQTPTFLSAGSLLDHIYINPQMFTVLDNSVVSVYYSDHQAIKVSLIFI